MMKKGRKKERQMKNKIEINERKLGGKYGDIDESTVLGNEGHKYKLFQLIK
jgi:hypothetical protein